MAEEWALVGRLQTVNDLCFTFGPEDWRTLDPLDFSDFIGQRGAPVECL